MKETFQQVKERKVSTRYFIKINIQNKLKDQAILKKLFKQTLQEMEIGNTLSVDDYRDNVLALANFYVEGYDLEWERLHEGEAKRRISLPTYPFEKERYWISEDKTIQHISTVTSLHPLLDASAPTLEQPYRFSKMLTGNEFYLKDHRVQGIRILPGVAYLEMARAARSIISPNDLVVHKPSISLKEEDINYIKNYVEELIHPPFKTKIVQSAIKLLNGSIVKPLFKVTVKGLEHLPSEGPFILCPNHTSHLDGVALLQAIPAIYLPKIVALVAKDYFAKSKLWAWFLKTIGGLPFDRTGDEYGVYKNLKYIELCKEANRILILFPEGTRSPDGELQEIKKGVAWFVKQTQLKVVPVYIEGAHQLMPKGARLPRPGKILVTFGAALNFNEGKEHSNQNNIFYYQDVKNKLYSALLSLKNK